MVIERDVSVQRDLQLFTGSEVIALKYLLDLTVEAFDHAVCLELFRRGEAVLDGELDSETHRSQRTQCNKG